MRMVADLYPDDPVVFREDLARFPENGWALRGVAEALGPSGNTAEADQVKQRFAAAWVDSDIR